MPKHIGIVACSGEGAALCYRTICAEGPALMGTHAHPEISMHTHSLAEYMIPTLRDDWRGVAKLMLDSAHKLKATGAEFLICPDNTIHRAFEFVALESPLPWLHIVEEVASEAKRHGFKRLAVTGTRYTMQGPVYPQKLREVGIDYRFPNDTQINEINRIIFDELVNGVFKPEGVRYFQQVIEHMKNDGCDAVVLGCTEIPLIINDENSSLPTLDSTRLLARAALRFALKQ
jgi:aspartate racemase